MKNLIFLVTIIVVGLFSSCSKEKLGDSIFDVSERTRNEFDLWLLSNYTYPYNIDFKYRMEDIESDRTYTLAPADIHKADTLAQIIKFVWLETYDEVAGINFTRMYVPKVIHLIGSPAYDSQGYIILGTAEGGLKVTLYDVNRLTIDPVILNSRYFKTMHHEFAHILNQTKRYNPEFDKISDALYVGSSWVNVTNAQAYTNGFVTPYARSAPGEDFAELYSVFVTRNATEWSSIITQAGTSGAAIINQKIEIVTNYMKSAYSIDIYELRDIVQRRSSDVKSLFKKP